MPQMKIDIPLPPEIDRDDRLQIADEVLEFIRERTDKGRDKNGRKFTGYSKSYIQSLDFKIAHKSAGKVNLKLTGDMMIALQLLKDKRESLTIGYEKNTEENDKAEGNIKGTYGDLNRKPKPRNFLGISMADLSAIIAKNSDLSQWQALKFVKENYDPKQSDKL
jgi:hypothetical protein